MLDIVSWQIVYVLFNFAKLIVVDPCMFYCCSFHDYLLFHVFLMSACLVCHERLCSECIELTNMPTRYLFSAKSRFLLSLKSVTKLAVLTCLLMYFLFLSGSSSLRDFYQVLCIDSCRAIICYVLNL